jgi:hypothetical protein
MMLKSLRLSSSKLLLWQNSELRIGPPFCFFVVLGATNDLLITGRFYMLHNAGQVWGANGTKKGKWGLGFKIANGTKKGLGFRVLGPKP